MFTWRCQVKCKVVCKMVDFLLITSRQEGFGCAGLAHCSEEGEEWGDFTGENQMCKFNKVFWNPPTNVNVLEKAFKEVDMVKWGQKDGALIQWGQKPCKQRQRYRCKHTERGKVSIYKPRRENSGEYKCTTPWCWTSSLLDYEWKYFNCWSQSLSSIILWQSCRGHMGLHTSRAIGLSRGC